MSMGKNISQKIIALALVFGALQFLTGSVHAQGLIPVSAANRLQPPDSTFTIKSGITTGVNTGSNPANYKLNLSNGLSIRPGGASRNPGLSLHAGFSF
jgi:hypothetical protein